MTTKQALGYLPAYDWIRGNVTLGHGAQIIQPDIFDPGIPNADRITVVERCHRLALNRTLLFFGTRHPRILLEWWEDAEPAYEHLSWFRRMRATPTHLGVLAQVRRQSDVETLATARGLQFPASKWVLLVDPSEELNIMPLEPEFVIVGTHGAKYRRSRPMDPDAVRCLRDQCAVYGAPFWFRSWSGFVPDANGVFHPDQRRHVPVLDGRSHCEAPEWWPRPVVRAECGGPRESPEPSQSSNSLPSHPVDERGGDVSEALESGLKADCVNPGISEG